ncbi:helix-turn-helix domain-containing protein [Kineosporia succinea]|uniref:Transcriptional regulator with XRE-family HTH domain n=1 Tax=Kineosporia succinea TaxID=84632 RepID=A0ABT9PBR5_9ACTN|nr:helix-turn-helix domain-containing protein [Kineosporia succinea]MDP9829951.1 transcriptional regulator with XRE-family HTH domain [Kineosporia succinea]
MSDGAGSAGAPGAAREELAECLSGLKERCGKSYTVLARRTGISRSTLHRYCQGAGVPESFSVVETIAAGCGASRDELLRLHRLWVRATADEAPAETGWQTPRGGERTPLTDGGGRLDGPDGPVGRAGRRGVRAGAVVLLVVCVGVVFVAVVGAGVLLGVPGGWFGSVAGSGSVSALGGAQEFYGPAWRDSPKPVPERFFGVTVNSSTGLMPDSALTGVSAVRLWDSGSTWAKIEPRRGTFDWSTPDRLVAGAQRAGLPVLFTFGATPSWASPRGPRAPYDDGSRASAPDRLEDWDAFVAAVVGRYGDRVEAYELWNLAPSPQFFTGSARTLVEMTRRASAIVRDGAPGADVVCPGLGDQWNVRSREYLAQFAQLGGFSYCDVASVKLHQRENGRSPESVVELAGLIEATMRRSGVVMRTWNTGTAYRLATADHLDQERAGDYAVRFYLVGLYVRYERSYFYNWGGTRIPIVLQPVGGRATRAAVMVGRLRSWLRGAQITQCGHGATDGLPPTVWQCWFLLPDPEPASEAPPPEPPHEVPSATSGGGNDGDGASLVPGGRPAVIRWTESGTADITLGSGARRVRELDGSSAEVSPGDAVRIGERPVLIEFG